MKIGSKLAIYKLKLAYDGEKGKIYQATVVENFQVKTQYGNDWEQHFINNILIYTDLELEIANFDKKLAPKVFTKKDGSTFQVEQSQLCFERISNPEKSIIRVLDFEYKIINKRNKKGNILYRPDKNCPYENQNWHIYKCEYDFAGWKLPEKAIETEIKYYKKQHEKWKVDVSLAKQELRKIKKKCELLSEKNNALLLENRELKLADKKNQKRVDQLTERKKALNDKLKEISKIKQKPKIKIKYKLRTRTKVRTKIKTKVKVKTKIIKVAQKPNPKSISIERKENAVIMPKFNEEELI